MTFTVEPSAFARLRQELADSHNALLEQDPPSGGGQSGTITFGNIKATYAYTPNLLTLNVTHGGNFLVDHAIHSKLQAAIEALSR